MLANIDTKSYLLVKLEIVGVQAADSCNGEFKFRIAQIAGIGRTSRIAELEEITEIRRIEPTGGFGNKVLRNSDFAGHEPIQIIKHRTIYDWDLVQSAIGPCSGKAQEPILLLDK